MQNGALALAVRLVRFSRSAGVVADEVCVLRRLERSALAIFEPQAVAPTAMAAELSKLSESLVLRVCGFLRAPEFCRLTQTNKVSQPRGFAVGIPRDFAVWFSSSTSQTPRSLSGRRSWPKVLSRCCWMFGRFIA